MTRSIRALCFAAGTLLVSGTFAEGQSPSATVETRPATTTFFGDTGFWFVPTAEIVPDRRFSGSGQRANWDYRQGLTDVTHIAGTAARGFRDRVELFGSFRVITRIDRDLGLNGWNNGPIFRPTDQTFGGLVNDYPLVRRDWSGNVIGDLLVGVKYNVMSEWRQQPVALAVRGTLKLPTGDTDGGAGTGKADVMGDVIVSKELAEMVEIAGVGGVVVRGDPNDPVKVDVSNGLQWGLGLAVPSRSILRLTAEIHGEQRFADTLTASAPLTSERGIASVSPLISTVDNVTKATLGLTFQSRKGFFIGYAVNHTRPSADPADIGVPPHKNYWSHQLRFGYHPGVRIYVPPPSPKQPEPPPPTPAPHTLTVRAQANPTTIDVLKASNLTCVGTDSLKHTLTFRWSGPVGKFGNANQANTTWTAPDQVGPVPLTCTADDNMGMTASDTVMVQVIRPAAPPARTFMFEDVHFDFDRYSLRPEATRVLDEAIKALMENPTLRLQIEGHTCNIGTAEYNLALGDRRASSVREYLAQRGITGTRLETVSYGEERPKYDNAREEQRRLNRRAALVVRLQ